MVVELADPEIVSLDAFKVAGLAHRGPPGDEFDDIWTDFHNRVDELVELTTGDESYGVIYEYDSGGDEFTYVAGVPVGDTSGLSPQLTIVEIPAGDYAVFETPVNELSGLLAEIETEWAPDAEYERVDGPLFERYPPEYQLSERTGQFEFCVPVDRT